VCPKVREAPSFFDQRRPVRILAPPVRPFANRNRAPGTTAWPGEGSRCRLSWCPTGTLVAAHCRLSRCWDSRLPPCPASPPVALPACRTAYLSRYLPVAL